MGSTYHYKCNKCGYETELNIGGGFITEQYLIKYEDGQYSSKQAKHYLKNSPNNTTLENNGYTIALCEHCKKYVSILDLKIVILDNKDNISELILTKPQETKTKFKQYCFKCNNELKTSNKLKKDFRNEQLKCPKCGEILEEEISALWD